MTESKNPSINMVIGYDFSESAELALARAISLAVAEPRHILHVLGVLDRRHEIRPHGHHKADYTDAEDMQQQLGSAVEALLARENPASDIHFFVHVHIGKPAEEILALAAEVGAHLILIGSHGHTGLQRALMGSVSEKVVREAGCPVLVVRNRIYPDVELETIVKAPEGHEEAQAYVRPHRYSYFNQMIERQKSSWPWY